MRRIFKKENTNRTYIILSINYFLVIDQKSAKEIYVRDTDNFVEELISRGYTEIKVEEID